LTGRKTARHLVGLTVLALAMTTGTASADGDGHDGGHGRPLLKPGAVFTSSNTVPNRVLAFNRAANGQLTPAGEFPTGGDGRPAGNPPSGFTVLDSAGPVELTDDGDNNSCLFVVNAGSNSVSSFRVRPDGIDLADVKSSGGQRPASLTSTTRGPGRAVLYVLNSEETTASIQGYWVTGGCTLIPIPGSNRPTPNTNSVPAAIRFDEQGRFLTVSERYAPTGFPSGNGDLVTYPVNGFGVAGTPVINAPSDRTPYGLDYNHQGILSVTNEHLDAPPFPNSTVSTFRQLPNGQLVPLDTEPSPGAACWNLFTNNGKFLYVTNPAGNLGPGFANVNAYQVDRNGQMTLVDKEHTPFESIDNALSHNDEYLYVLSANVVTPGTASAISAFKIDRRDGTLTPIDEETIPGNTTSGLAAW
jgi:6-phosphogluconolactonase